MSESHPTIDINARRASVLRLADVARGLSFRDSDSPRDRISGASLVKVVAGLLYDSDPRLPDSRRLDWWLTEPELGRVAHGVANRVDRLKAIENGQVPAVAALAWLLLNDWR